MYVCMQVKSPIYLRHLLRLEICIFRRYTWRSTRLNNRSNFVYYLTLMILDQTYLLKLYDPFMQMTQNAAELIIRGQLDRGILQQDVSTLYRWSETWGMKFNTKKCKHLCITNKRKSDWKPLTALELPSVSHCHQKKKTQEC